MSESTFNLGSVIEDAKKVITNPHGFYTAMPTSGGYVNPLIFAVVMAVVSAVIMVVLGILGMGSAGSMGFAPSLSMLFILPIGAVIACFVGGAIFYVIWKLMGSDKDYETAFRCVAYTFAIVPIGAILSIIPYAEVVGRTLWGCFLLYTASVVVHGISAQTAKIVFGIFALIGIVMGTSAERTSRHYADTTEEALKRYTEMSPEETGQAVGEFLKGIDKAVREAEAEAKKD